jgi:hypothetical protein
MATTNPNKANQHKPDPRQSLFLQRYLDPNSKTFSNAYRSALKAGYEEEYAKNMTGQMPTWLSESINDLNLTRQAEKNLREYLELEPKDRTDKTIKADLTKFTLERLNKKKYSARSEHTGEGGEPIKVIWGGNEDSKD